MATQKMLPDGRINTLNKIDHKLGRSRNLLSPALCRLLQSLRIESLRICKGVVKWKLRDIKELKNWLDQQSKGS
jgi:hypothetical protein